MVASPKLSAAYVAGNTRLHSSFGTGIRPPSGFELAFTNNPALRPERTRSVDAGMAQQSPKGAVRGDVIQASAQAIGEEGCCRSTAYGRRSRPTAADA